MSDNKDGMLEVDDNFGLDDSAEDDDEFALQDGDGDDGQQMMNFEGQDDQEDEDDGDEYGQQDMDDGQDEQDEDDQDQQDMDMQEDDDEPDHTQANQYQRKEFQFAAGANQKSAGKNEDLKTKKVENEQFDEALEVDDSNEIESDDEDAEPNNAGQQTNAAQLNQDADEDEQELPGQYNAANYANLNVSAEVKELFEYIGRYKPQKIDLETTFKPFIPEYMP